MGKRLQGSDQKTNIEQRGLVGGTPEWRLRKGRKIVIDHPLFLDQDEGEACARELASFVGEAQVLLEVGFGKGQFLLELARMNPQARVLGFEVRSKYLKIALRRLEKAGVDNARLVLGDARWAMPRLVAPQSLDAFFLMFPDPWWKKRHHKKRFLDEQTLATLKSLLKPNALLVVRSDVPLVLDLANDILGADPEIVNVGDAGMDLPVTDRERTCAETGTPVDQMVYRFIGEREV